MVKQLCLCFKIVVAIFFFLIKNSWCKLQQHMSILSFICSRKTTSWKIWALEFDHSQPNILSATLSVPMPHVITHPSDPWFYSSSFFAWPLHNCNFSTSWNLEHWCGLKEISTSNAMILPTPSFLTCFSIIIIIIIKSIN